MSKRRTERLLSIVVLLLSSRRYLTAEQIRAAVSGYPDEQEAFKRMFERDKEELRDLGIPLETGRSSPLDDDLGYRISRQDYELPEIHLEPDEAAVLGIASRVWQSAELAGAAAGAALKLRAASREADGDGAGEPAARHPAAAEHAGARVRPAVGGGPRPPAGHLRSPGERPLRGDEADPRAVGRGQPARPLVRRRPRPDARRAAGVPAQPHHRAGEAGRPAGQRQGPRGRGRPRARQGLGQAAGQGSHRDAAGTRGRGRRAAPLGPGRAGRRAPRLGPGHDRLLRRRTGTRATSRRSAPTSWSLDPPELREAVIRQLKGALA